MIFIEMTKNMLLNLQSVKSECRQMIKESMQSDSAVSFPWSFGLRRDSVIESGKTESRPALNVNLIQLMYTFIYKTITLLQQVFFLSAVRRGLLQLKMHEKQSAPDRKCQAKNIYGYGICVRAGRMLWLSEVELGGQEMTAIRLRIK